jgi:hypothetical protein
MPYLTPGGPALIDGLCRRLEMCDGVA